MKLNASKRLASRRVTAADDKPAWFDEAMKHLKNLAFGGKVTVVAYDNGVESGSGEEDPPSLEVYAEEFMFDSRDHRFMPFVKWLESNDLSIEVKPCRQNKSQVTALIY